MICFPILLRLKAWYFFIKMIETFHRVLNKNIELDVGYRH